MLTIIEKVIFLQNIEVFAEVPTEQLATLAAITEEVEMIKGDVIFRERDPADALYLIREGSIKLHRGETEISVAEAGESFGTWALFDEEPRVVTATAVEDSQLLRIDRDDFIDLLADHVQIAQGVLKTIVKRLRSLITRVA
ncbi:MAG: cyclic nucleotide-binding domain-containing protein [candidate division Zixibacteria bacterium]|jgi:CRP-like cAMP-binding protein|nr:cyclic nucleotide-binding domain-containing protein [candidate division Zixibacteria bacterium]